MKIQKTVKFIIIISISLFLVGIIQMGFSHPVNDIYPVPQTTTKTSFDPFITGWMYRKQVTINQSQVAGDLNDFPVLLHIIDTDVQTNVQSDADDILFMDDIGVATQLNHEIEDYDAETGELIAWVNIPNLSSAIDTIFYMYYGNPTCTNQQHVIETWDSDYQAVWHMNDATPSTIKDSTVHEYTGTKAATSGPTQIDGKIGKSQSFDGLNDNIWINGQSVLGIDEKTMSFWMKIDPNNDYQTILTNAEGGTWDDEGLDIAKDHGTNITVVIGNDNSPNHYLIIYMKPIPDYTMYHYYTARQSGTNLSLYLDGLLYAWTTTTSGSEASPSYNMSIGKSHQNSPFYYWFDGELDEIRMSTIARGSSWITTEYNNQNSPSTFVVFGPQETIPYVKTIMFGKITNLDTGENYMTFNAVKLRCIRLSPFSFTSYSSNEQFVISNDYRGLVIQTRIFAIGQMYP